MTEKTKNYLGWVLIIGILLVALSAWRYSGAYSRSMQPDSYRSFAVSGEGRAVVVPDIATFTFGVITEGGNDVGQLQIQNTEKVNQAITFLKQNGIAEQDIQTSGYNLTPRYQSVYCNPQPGQTRVCPPASIVGYTVEQTVRVKIRQDHFSQIGTVMSGVVSAGANTVSQLNFTLDDPAMAENEAREQAIKQAQEKARSVAKAARFRLGDLLSIDEGGYQPFYGLESAKYGSAMGMGGDGFVPAPAPAIEPGSQEVLVNVTLRYAID